MEFLSRAQECLPKIWYQADTCQCVLYMIPFQKNTSSKLALRTREQHRYYFCSFIVDFGQVFAHMVLRNTCIFQCIAISFYQGIIPQHIKSKYTMSKFLGNLKFNEIRFQNLQSEISVSLSLMIFIQMLLFLQPMTSCYNSKLSR